MGRTTGRIYGTLTALVIFLCVIISVSNLSVRCAHRVPVMVVAAFSPPISHKPWARGSENHPSSHIANSPLHPSKHTWEPPPRRFLAAASFSHSSPPSIVLRVTCVTEGYTMGSFLSKVVGGNDPAPPTPPPSSRTVLQAASSRNAGDRRREQVRRQNSNHRSEDDVQDPQDEPSRRQQKRARRSRGWTKNQSKGPPKAEKKNRKMRRTTHGSGRKTADAYIRELRNLENNPEDFDFDVNREANPEMLLRPSNASKRARPLRRRSYETDSEMAEEEAAPVALRLNKRPALEIGGNAAGRPRKRSYTEDLYNHPRRGRVVCMPMLFNDLLARKVIAAKSWTSMRAFDPTLLPWHFGTESLQELHIRQTNKIHPRSGITGACLLQLAPSANERPSRDRARVSIEFACSTGDCSDAYDGVHTEQIPLIWLNMLGTGALTDEEDWAALVHSRPNSSASPIRVLTSLGGLRLLEHEDIRQASHLCGNKDCQSPSHLTLESQSQNNFRKACHKREKCGCVDEGDPGRQKCIVGTARLKILGTQAHWSATLAKNTRNLFKYSVKGCRFAVSDQDGLSLTEACKDTVGARFFQLRIIRRLGTTLPIFSSIYSGNDAKFQTFAPKSNRAWCTNRNNIDNLICTLPIRRIILSYFLQPTPSLMYAMASFGKPRSAAEVFEEGRKRASVVGRRPSSARGSPIWARRKP
ncbi:hypothetical protein P154DRAFT_533428 [Amniculicola lignicola CBS 123094]|uniref:Zinc-binding loop region of homing endonuclease domain-containing protein n=1 Tax=Amniculicola lignicola CBS 123094 TaxID=1392246 RepID=A0A6A5WPT1_9PLEO|nr:hypothetical protein P154DRAFT_533428 [Amniculicola lignicola CBS 123094]